MLRLQVYTACLVKHGSLFRPRYLSSFLVTFTEGANQMFNKKPLEGRSVYFGLQFEEMIYHGGEDMIVGVGSWLVTLCTNSESR